ncbi:MAG: hypothetical protein JWO08_1535 [Verrucomicrobiaceae bacterium]|nr:hypothetical protein [Verrucomicrobiaceae bacterium]
MPPAKSIFKSKTAFAGAITAVTGAIGTLRPEAGQWIASHASVLLLTAGLLQILLRKVSHGQVILFPETDGL